MLSGRGTVGTERRPIHEGQLAVFGDGAAVEPRSDATQEEKDRAGLEVLLLGGLPIREQVSWYGPFVMNTKEEIIEAIEDYQAGRMGSIPPGSAGPDVRSGCASTRRPSRSTPRGPSRMSGSGSRDATARPHVRQPVVPFLGPDRERAWRILSLGWPRSSE